MVAASTEARAGQIFPRSLETLYALSVLPREAPSKHGTNVRQHGGPVWAEAAVDSVLSPDRSLPPPLSVLRARVATALRERDLTGMRKRMFELGLGVARFAASCALAILADRRARVGQAPPTSVAKLLRGAARLSDGHWCEFARTLGTAAAQSEPWKRLFKFLTGPSLVALVAARNRFAHDGGAGEDAPARALAVLDAARDLLSLEVRAEEGELVIADDEVGSLVVSPWLPRIDGPGGIGLLDAPHAVGKPWRSTDPESGEHREQPALDAAVRELLGSGAAPVLPTDCPPLAGREAALSILRRGAEEAASGGVRVVVLSGPQGIGRTAMLRAVSQSAAGFGFRRVFEAACSEERRGPLRALKNASEELHEADAFRAILGEALSGALSGRDEGLGPAIEAVEEALVESSLSNPTMLLVDDVQWADEQTIALLRLVTERATRGANGRLLVVVGAREMATPTPALRALIGQVERDVGTGATRVALVPLEPGAAAKVVQSVAPVGPRVERALVAGAAGAPFLLVQPLLTWYELGALVWVDGLWEARAAEDLERAPPGIAVLVRARIASYFDSGSEVERAAKRILACVALADEGVLTSALLTAMDTIDISERDCERAVDGLLEVDLLRTTGGGRNLAIGQRSVALAIREDFGSKVWFRRAHKALLDALAGSDDADLDAAFLAAGYEIIGAKAESDRWAERGAVRALAIGDFMGAERLAIRLVESARSPASRARGAVYVAEARIRSGRYVEAIAALDAAGVCEGSDALAVRARVHRFAAASASGKVSQEDDNALVTDADHTGDLCLGAEARIAVGGSRRGEAGLQLAREAMARIPRDDESADLRYRASSLRLELLWESRSAADPECRRAAEETFAAARAAGSPWAELDSKLSAAAFESDGGNHDAAISLLGDVAHQASTRHFGTLRRQALVNLAAIELRRGRYDRAESASALAVAECHAAGSTLTSVATSIRADALLRLGRAAEALIAIEESLRLKTEARDGNVALALIRKAEIEAFLERPSEATATAIRAVDAAQALGNEDQTRLCRLWLALHALRTGAEGAKSALIALVAELAPHESRLRPASRALLTTAQGCATTEDAAAALGLRLLP